MSAPLSYSVDGAAKAIGVDPQRIRAYLIAGKLPSFTLVAGGKKFIRASDLARMAAPIQRGDPKVATQVKPLTPKVPRARKRRKVICGVYILYQAERVAYVGRSVDVRCRIQTHHDDGRLFDDIRIIPCEEGVSVWLEKELIRALKPIQNRIRYGRTAKAAERILAEARVA